MAHHHKSVEQLERDCRNHEQIHGGDAVCMIAKKYLPSLGGWPSTPVHILGNGCLSNIDAEFEQFTLDARCAPQWVGDTHLPDQGPDFQRGFRLPCSRPGFSAPERPKSLLMPADHRLRLDNRQGIQGARRYNHTRSHRSALPKTSRSGLFRRKTLSWWHTAMISVCRSARDRKKSASVPQISLRMSTMPQNIAQYRPICESDSICGRGRH